MKENSLRFRVFILLLLAFAADNRVSAQQEHPNSVTLIFSDYKFPKLHNDRYQTTVFFYDQFGISYDRKINKKLEISLSYSQWINFAHNDVPGTPAIVSWSEEGASIGAIEDRRSYKMIDLFIKYRCHLDKRNELKPGIGASYTIGANFYIDSVTNVPYVNTVYSHVATGKYWGWVPQLSYDHYFLKNRLSAGADFRYRKYIGIPTDQVDYGIHISYNF